MFCKGIPCSCWDLFYSSWLTGYRYWAKLNAVMYCSDWLFLWHLSVQYFGLFLVVTIFFATKLTKAELPDWMDWILVGYVAFHVVVHLILSVSMICINYDVRTESEIYIKCYVNSVYSVFICFMNFWIVALTSNFICDIKLHINTVFRESNREHFSEQLILLRGKNCYYCGLLTKPSPG